MLFAGNFWSAKKRFVRLSQDRVIRVSNFPLQFKVMTRKTVPNEEKWLQLEERFNRNKYLRGRDKQGSLPAWFKRGEVEGGVVNGYLEN